MNVNEDLSNMKDYLHIKLNRKETNKTTHLYTNDEKYFIHQELKDNNVVKETKIPLSKVLGDIEKP
jgi:hypothetical protein